MQIVSKRNRTYNKFYDDDYDLDLKSVPKAKKYKNKKPSTKNAKPAPDVKKKTKISENNETSTLPNTSNNDPGVSVNSSAPNSSLNSTMEDKFTTVLPFPPNIASNFNYNSKSVDPELLNNIMNSSSINSESHKKYELDNLEFFRNLIVDKYDTYSGEDNRLVGQLPNSLLVNNLDSQFLNPWIDMIIPNRSKPYAAKIKNKSQDRLNYEHNTTDSTATKDDDKSKRFLYLNENQVFNIIDSILEQIINTPKNESIRIDWMKVSKSSSLSEEVCKDFWWSFDKKLVKDKYGGCLFKPDWNHYYKVDEWYFVDLKNRVQNLIQLANECKLEREQILFHFKNNAV